MASDTEKLINKSQGDAIVRALETIAGSGLSIRIAPARDSGDAVGTITINGTDVILYSDPHTAEFTKLAGIEAGAQINPGLATASAAGLMSAADYTLLHNSADVVKLAYSNSLPGGNALIADADDASALGAYVECPPLKLSDLLTNVDSSLDMVHPAFMVNGQQVSRLYVGKYQASRLGTRLYSLNGHDPVNTINMNNIMQYAINKGGRHHEITASEWALRALMAKKRGTMPKGNNYYGRDISEALPGGIPTYVDGNGRTCRVATGTGPITWSDTGDTTGVWDMNGNLNEWAIGVRLMKGELQVIPWNNAAAMSAADMSATSDKWRAIDATAASWDALFIVPDGSGTTANSIKLDWVNNHWQWQKAAIANASDTPRNGRFGNTTIAADVGAAAALYLRAMALAPDDGAAASEFGATPFYANNNGEDRHTLRGGFWADGAGASLFTLSIYVVRNDMGSGIGGRLAYYE